MVDVSYQLELHRFPWTYSKVHDKDGNFVAFRVRLDYMIVPRFDDIYSFDIYHFTSQSDLMDNASLAKDCGYEVDFGHSYIYASPYRHKNIFNQIIEHEKLCVLLQST